MTRGGQAVKLDMAALGSEHNYTRSYYMNGSDYIISGSCEESVVRVFSAKTGEGLECVPGSKLAPVCAWARGWWRNLIGRDRLFAAKIKLDQI